MFTIRYKGMIFQLKKQVQTSIFFQKREPRLRWHPQQTTSFG